MGRRRLSSVSHRRGQPARPKFATRRRPERETLGPRVAQFATLLGTPPMPWQQDLLDVALEIDSETGHLAYREVVVTVPRQQGKTTLILAVEADVCVNRAPATVIYTAQTGNAARKKLLDEHVPAIRASELAPLLKKTIQTMGGEAVHWKTGSRIELAAGTQSAGHGGVLDLAVLDETFHDVDDRREQALLPGMLTKPDGQLWVVSTQGTDASHYLIRKCEQGRLAAVEDSGRGICYLEFAASPDDDPGDPVTWWSCMPALGHTVSEDVVAHMFQTMSLPEFRRSALNILDSADVDRPISKAGWLECQDGTAAPDVGGLTVAIEAAIDSSASSVVGADVLRRCEVIDYRLGTSWVPDRVAELYSKYGCTVVLDARGPAKRFVQPLEQLGVPFLSLSSAEVAAAALLTADLVRDGGLWVRPHPVLDDAVESVPRRWSGDQWFFARRGGDVDASPLIALSLAVLMAGEPVPEVVPPAEVSVSWI